MATIENVVDGDTVDTIIDLGFKISSKQRLRLARVDTPERNQPGYAMAKDFVAETVQGKMVKVETEKVSKFGYYLAEIILEDGSNLSDLLISKGLGVPYSGGKK
jgi:micrococcal nuclease